MAYTTGHHMGWVRLPARNYREAIYRRFSAFECARLRRCVQHLRCACVPLAYPATPPKPAAVNWAPHVTSKQHPTYYVASLLSPISFFQASSIKHPRRHCHCHHIASPSHAPLRIASHPVIKSASPSVRQSVSPFSLLLPHLQHCIAKPSLRLHVTSAGHRRYRRRRLYASIVSQSSLVSIQLAQSIPHRPPPPSSASSSCVCAILTWLVHQT